eukprot:m.31953 g.31953  ORF g.31953 m.31953 type:complete len:363 (-) comp42137_c0_seq1:518-1606(-)
MRRTFAVFILCVRDQRLMYANTRRSSRKRPFGRESATSTSIPRRSWQVCTGQSLMVSGALVPSSLPEAIKFAQTIETRAATSRGVQQASANVVKTQFKHQTAASKASVPAPKVSSSAGAKPLSQKPRVCFYCKKPGHVIADCLKLKAKQTATNAVRPLRYVEGTLDGRPTHLTTGAQTTLVRSAVLTQEAQLEDTDMVLHGAGGEPLAVRGFAHVEVDAGQTSLRLKVLVVDNLTQEVLVGNDFLEGVGAVIDFRGSGSLLIGNCSTKLLSGTVVGVAVALLDPELSPFVKPQLAALTAEEQLAFDALLENNSGVFATDTFIPGRALVPPTPVDTGLHAPVASVPAVARRTRHSPSPVTQNG